MRKRQRVAIAPIEWDVVDLAETCNFEIVGFFDKKGSRPTGSIPLLGGDEHWPEYSRRNPDVRIILGVDPPSVRERLFEFYRKELTVTAISPAAHVSSHARLGQGCIVQRGVNIMPMVEIGIGSYVNVGTTIAHETRVGNYCSIGPNAFMAGSVRLGDHSYVGAGAIILQNVQIGRGAKVGAGAVVAADVEPGEVVMGAIARTSCRSPRAQ
jgi:sugar O-acyltransferase (sialic acid O-acetyltransferase NeuD family)